MSLNAYAAEKRLAIFDDLKRGIPPREGTYRVELLREAKAKGAPQMGSTHYTPAELVFEFIYPDAQSSATVLSIHLDSPERIVFLPVPGWVIESIWQGEISGSYHFESEALRLVEEFRASLASEANAGLFGPQMAKRRE